ncbi:MAG TPA: ABC transporter substrate-binding protein [Magnetospirillum sp.]|nr:ABC transporter substrate-binding protein [Magnetospirillum sp.]
MICSILWREALAEQKVVVYTSIKTSLIGELQAAFTAKHPDIRMEYLSAGAGKVMAKIVAEHRAGRINADVLWSSEVPDFYDLRARGVLLPYEPADRQARIEPLPDNGGTFTTARLSLMGIAYNIHSVKNPPEQWSDLTLTPLRGSFAIANPTLSGTSTMSIAALVEAFGWSYIENLRTNGTKLGQGAQQVVDDTASGALLACLAVDYLAADRIERGGAIALVLPPELIVIPSPIAIFRDSPNQEAAKAFVEFVLSQEGQSIIANEGTLPVRTDVEVPARFGLPPVAEAMRRALPIDYDKAVADKERTVKKFTTIMQK